MNYRDGGVRIINIFGEMAFGGAEIRTVELQERSPKGYTFDYLTLSGREGELKGRIEKAGGRIIPLRLSPTFPWKLYRVLREGNYHAIDSHIATASGAMLFVAKVARVPVRIAHFHSDADGHPNSTRRQVQRWVGTKLIAFCATHIVGVSPSTLTCGYRRDWGRDPRAKIVPSGFDIPHVTERRGNSRPVIICVGRPSLEKDRARAVRILSHLHRRGTMAVLKLVGPPGEDSEELRRAIHQHNLQDFVEDLGSRTDVLALMSESDALIVTSKREGLPGVILEALSVGTPVLAGDLPGSSWIAQQVEGVKIAALADGDETWGEAAKQLLDRASLGRNQVVESFRESSFFSANADETLLQIFDAHAKKHSWL